MHRGSKQVVEPGRPLHAKVATLETSLSEPRRLTLAQVICGQNMVSMLTMPHGTYKQCTWQVLPHRIADGPQVAQRAVRLPGDLFPAQQLTSNGVQRNV